MRNADNGPLKRENGITSTSTRGKMCLFLFSPKGVHAIIKKDHQGQQHGQSIYGGGHFLFYSEQNDIFGFNIKLIKLWRQ
ncbi:hypothetical protein TNIN_455781 [Trichonephila inaurata madagascariensis]|uniref:Uncharacterized protein n=1 Tax=Trichonephila inaurata madagascariensis TaxID=2747483 RepID=A0A8X7BYV0_9ARAC|nr:hypothetical protein TNIN_455781 [Trichonephila inaurata madagascariensis]